MGHHRHRYNAYNHIFERQPKAIFTLTGRFALILLFVTLFLPWTQNFRGKGKLTTLNPSERPQTLNSIIPGRIEKWYVQEGQRVKKGDTMLFISEVKEDYLDPNLVPRTDDQILSKEKGIGSYQLKLKALENQYKAIERDQVLKTAQLRNKVKQTRAKMISDSAKIVEADVKLVIAKRQVEAFEKMFKDGIKSLAEYEAKKASYQQAITDKTAMVNNYITAENEWINAQLQLNNLNNEFEQKLAYNQADRFALESQIFDGEASVSKMRIQRSNYSIRTQNYYVLAPQDGYVVKALKSGIGEVIKEGTSLVEIQPYPFKIAAEMYIDPLNVALVEKGQKVRLQFDGWPALIFGGWPGVSFGTFGGVVVAIDQTISENGKYRLLIAPDPSDKAWPDLLKVGTGANGIGLLKDVPIWYELWRNINGFPPEYYKPLEQAGKESTKKEK
jgi:adhesin transport system membrane fusion protein